MADEAIRELYAFLGDNPEGEGILGVHTGDGWMPLVTSRASTLPQMRETAKMMGNVLQRNVRLVRFSSREQLEEFHPEQAGVPAS